MTELIQANLRLLDQTSDLLARLDSGTYVRPSPVFLNSAIGGHVRHCLEHYESLLHGLPAGRVNYDHRARDPGIETQPVLARARVLEIRARLSALGSSALPDPIMVLMDHGGVSSHEAWQPTSAGRELQFLISHTVHHFAIIAGLCWLHGVPVSEEFGVAPSTVRHRTGCNA
jgi:DinB superfamily